MHSSVVTMVSMMLPPRGLLIFEGSAYEKWLHRVPAVRQDMVTTDLIRLDATAEAPAPQPEFPRRATSTGPPRPRFGPRCDGSRTLTLIQVIDARRPRASDSLAGIRCAGGGTRCFTAALRSSSIARSFAAWRGARESLLRMRGEAFLAQGGTLYVFAPFQRASAAWTAV